MIEACVVLTATNDDTCCLGAARGLPRRTGSGGRPRVAKTITRATREPDQTKLTMNNCAKTFFVHGL